MWSKVIGTLENSVRKCSTSLGKWNQLQMFLYSGAHCLGLNRRKVKPDKNDAD